MHELIETIRAAVASDATMAQKAAGAAACRTIYAALDTEPGKPLGISGVAPVPAAQRITFEQVLDLMIAKLTVIANEHDKNVAPAPALPPSSGLRVPVAPISPTRAVPRPTRRTTTARKATSTRKP